VGILALMFGSLMINMMFNLTRIAEKHNEDGQHIKATSRKMWWAIGLSFPLVLALLLGGNYLTSKRKERMLTASAKAILDNNRTLSDKLLNFSFSKEWVNETGSILELYSRTDSHFPFVTVVVADTMLSSRVYFGFNKYYKNETNIPDKTRFIQSTTQDERAYLDEVFQHNLEKTRFTADGGQYELFYPYRKGNQCIVLHFSESPRFGRVGNK
jgi:hypothetical protein